MITEEVIQGVRAVNLGGKDSADLAGNSLNSSPKGVLEVIAADTVGVTFRQQQPEGEIFAYAPGGPQTLEEWGLAIFILGLRTPVNRQAIASWIMHELRPSAPSHLPDKTRGIFGSGSQAKSKKWEKELRDQGQEDNGSNPDGGEDRIPVVVSSTKKEQRQRQQNPPTVRAKGRIFIMPPPIPIVVVVVVVVIVVVVAAVECVVVSRRICAGKQPGRSGFGSRRWRQMRRMGRPKRVLLMTTAKWRGEAKVEAARVLVEDGGEGVGFTFGSDGKHKGKGVARREGWEEERQRMGLQPPDDGHGYDTSFHGAALSRGRRPRRSNLCFVWVN
ncbi:hypothetical protein GW17_00038823 [Ensete ventricosum]|nr:hypothetical protein GW17_00038823 [Ensete ventricosum]